MILNAICITISTIEVHIITQLGKKSRERKIVMS